MPVQTEQTLFAERGFFKETSGKTFSANYVIHVYEQEIEKGKRDKTAELTPAAKSQFVKNRDHIVEMVFKLVSEMIADGVDMKRGWIKTKETNDFDVLIAVPGGNYHATGFDEFFVKANDLEVLSNNLDFHLNIWYIDNDKLINEEKICNDGYNLKFEIQSFQKIK
jgi:hypothetical protein